MNLSYKIAISESSDIIFDGLALILENSDTIFEIIRIDNVEELLEIKDVEMLIINPMTVYNREKIFAIIKKKHPELNIVGILTSILESSKLHYYNSTINLHSSRQHILTTINELITKTESSNRDENLTDREIEVLVELINGKSNKEIAESLNISIHTVFTHRKNISTKTGVKSQSGLVIYAISKNIVSLDDFE